MFFLFKSLNKIKSFDVKEWFVVIKIIEKKSLSFSKLDTEYHWKQLTIDPYKSRRVDWSDDIIRCSNGNVRINGICDIENCPSIVKLEVPICNDNECLMPLVIDLPIIKS